MLISQTLAAKILDTMTRIQNRMETTARGDGRNITDGATARGSSFGKKNTQAKAPIRYSRDEYNKKEP